MSLEHVKMFCVVDGVEIPADRKKRRSITCSDACAKTRNNYLRERKEMRKCKYCGQPSTPEERESYRLWRKYERDKKKATAKKEVGDGRSDDMGTR
jgi:hypothetical protein